MSSSNHPESDSEHDPKRDSDQPLLASLALAASDVAAKPVGDCPPPEQLAAFIDNQLDASARASMMAHLNSCADCREHWIEVARLVDGDMPNVLAAQAAADPAQRVAGATASDRIVRLRRWLKDWIGSWQTIAVPLAGAAAVGIVAVLLGSPSLDQRIDAQLSAARDRTPALAQAAGDMPLPWDGAALGFSEAAAEPASRAFGAGVWLARQAVSQDTQQMPEALDATPAESWADSEWRAFYEFGRWATLLWIALHNGLPVDDLAAQQTILGELRNALAADGKNALTQEALQSIDGIDSALGALANGQDAATLRRLRARLMLAIQQLAPSSL